MRDSCCSETVVDTGCAGSRGYLIDVTGRITGVRGDWDDFARDNSGDGVCAEAIVGRSIWDSISGIETKAFLNTVFFVVRHERITFTTTYRCDSPDEMRRFRMRVSVVGEDILVDHERVEIARPLRDTTVLTPDFRQISRCSMCCAFQIEDRWLDTFLVAPASDFPKGYGLCPDCRTEARAEIGRLRGGPVALQA